ncbi:MAG TPA: DUF4167 domain-containing protein [Rhodomicrobium sp.]|nr:DUF4167 domain-containing protein [Rhodomicrobium sp.]
MRQGQQSRRGRNRGGRKPQNAMSRNYESSGPDVKIRGTAMHIAEKYASLARDAMSSGDTVAAENYLQHAEHYNRIILAAQAQNMSMPGMEGQPGMNGAGRFQQPEPFQRDYDGDADEGEPEEDFIPPQRSFPERAVYNQHQQPQPYIPQNAFPQIQPQPVVAPAPNGVQPASAEPYGPPQGDGDRMPWRRRRRPIGEHQPKTFNGRNGNGNSAQGPEGSPLPSESKPDEAAS